MTSEQAIQILTTFNEWRRGGERTFEIPVKDIGVAIDIGIEAIKIMSVL